MKECESFLERARSHLAELDSKRATVLENIEASEEAVVGVEGQVADTSPVGRVGGESVARIGVSCRPKRCGGPVWNSEPKSKSTHVVEKISSHTATKRCKVSTPGFASCSCGRKIPEVVRISKILTQAAQELQQLIQGQSTSAFPFAVANMVTNPLR